MSIKSQFKDALVAAITFVCDQHVRQANRTFFEEQCSIICEFTEANPEHGEGFVLRWNADLMWDQKPHIFPPPIDDASQLAEVRISVSKIELICYFRKFECVCAIPAFRQI